MIWYFPLCAHSADLHRAGLPVRRRGQRRRVPLRREQRVPAVAAAGRARGAHGEGQSASAARLAHLTPLLVATLLPLSSCILLACRQAHSSTLNLLYCTVYFIRSYTTLSLRSTSLSFVYILFSFFAHAVYVCIWMYKYSSSWRSLRISRIAADQTAFSHSFLHFGYRSYCASALVSFAHTLILHSTLLYSLFLSSLFRPFPLDLFVPHPSRLQLKLVALLYTGPKCAVYVRIALFLNF